jgi:hypothetical protein
MAVTVYFDGGETGTIPNGTRLRVNVEVPDALQVLDDNEKLVGIISMASLKFAEIDASNDDEDSPDEEAAAATA